MNYLLDTDIVIYWLNGNTRIHEKITSVKEKNIGISIISVAELYFGAFNSGYRSENVRTIENLVQVFEVVPFDLKMAKLFGEIKAELKRTGQPLLDADILIAASAIACGQTLVSNNTGHFSRITGLSLENWNSSIN